MSDYFAKIKQDDFDKCNICLKPAKLTWDHIPPEGSVQSIVPMKIESIGSRLIPEFKNKFLISQNGLKLRTLCEKCNNELLGKRLDPILNNFSRTIGDMLNSKLLIPETVLVKTKPNLLVKAILGHIIAAKIDIDDSLYDTKLRDVVWLNKKVPEDVNVFCWIYPYKQQSIIRDFVVMSLKNSLPKAGVMNLLKYFPFGFLITDAKMYDSNLNLTSYLTTNDEDEVEIPINLKNMRQVYYPEYYDEYSVLLFGNAGMGSLYAVPK